MINNLLLDLLIFYFIYVLFNAAYLRHTFYYCISAYFFVALSLQI